MDGWMVSDGCVRVWEVLDGYILRMGCSEGTPCTRGYLLRHIASVEDRIIITLNYILYLHVVLKVFVFEKEEIWMLKVSRRGKVTKDKEKRRARLLIYIFTTKEKRNENSIRF